MPPPRGKYQVKLNAVMFSMMVEELLSGPCTAQALADYTGMHVLTVQRTLRSMYSRGIVHVSAWEKDSQGRHVIRVFRFGEGRDAKRPAPKDRATKNREHRASQRIAAVHSALAGVSP